MDESSENNPLESPSAEAGSTLPSDLVRGNEIKHPPVPRQGGRITAAIHQPNFFPWLSFFDKIVRSDVFVIHDDVQMEKKKTGGTWQHRVRILVNNEANFITMPIDRSYHGFRKINEIEINNSIPWREKVIKTVKINYGKAPFFNYTFKLFQELLDTEESNLSRFNINAIRRICEEAGLNTDKFVLASDLNADGKATDKLVSILKKIGANVYIYGKGAQNYQENDKLIEAGIEPVTQNYEHPVYPQHGTTQFVVGLSIIDALMNVGNDGVKKLLKVQDDR